MRHTAARVEARLKVQKEKILQEVTSNLEGEADKRYHNILDILENQEKHARET